MSINVQISCRKFTIGVRISEDAIILDAAPIAKKFIGQNVKNLIDWAERFGKVTIFKLGETNDGKRSTYSNWKNIRRNHRI